jgi:hypothetical protein
MSLTNARRLLAEADQDELEAERILTISQAARMLRLSERTIWRRINVGDLVLVRMKRGEARVTLASVRAYRDGERQAATS